MKTAIARNLPRPQPRAAIRLRQRADLPALFTPPAALPPWHAGHDFLVPNPRPDLTMDPQTLRMIDVG